MAQAAVRVVVLVAQAAVMDAGVVPLVVRLAGRHEKCRSVWKDPSYSGGSFS